MNKYLSKYTYKRKIYPMQENNLRYFLVAVISFLIISGLSLRPTFAQSTETNSSAPTTPPKSLKGIDAYIHKVMNLWHVPGLAIAVVKDGKVVMAKGYGVREVGKPGKVDANTLFAIGSISKTMTTTALGTLVSEGRLSWDAPVTKYVKYFLLSNPYVTRHITLRDLLSHRNGYCDPTNMWFTSDDSDVVRRLRYQKPDYGFRDHFCYNSMMFLTASRFIPAITGENWHQYIRQHIFEPLNMTRTITTSRDIAKATNIAVPHAVVNGKLQPLSIFDYWPYDADIVAPISNIHSSAMDMTHWLLMLLANGHYDGKTILKPSVVREIETPQIFIGHDDRVFYPLLRAMSPKSDYYAQGLGVRIEDYGRHKLIFHGGINAGMTSFAAIVPDANLGVVVLSNTWLDNGVLGVVSYVLQSYLGVYHRDVSALEYRSQQKYKKMIRAAAMKLYKTRKPGTKAPLPLKDYAGMYKDDFYGTAHVKLKNGHLRLKLGNPWYTGKLTHWHDNTFRVAWQGHSFGTSYITFELNAYGKPVEIMFAQGVTYTSNKPMHYERVEKPDSSGRQ
ncbi:MAG TPA: serine hydrolase [Balneolales bacterium]|nr:serine hydrolase [Balneolales bacterium]